MLWWYERGEQRTTIEVLELPSGGFELHFVDEHGVEQVERFDNAGDLAKRQHEIQDRLIARGWSRAGDWLI